MAEIIKMPKLSDTMEEGVVAKWHKKVGEEVEEGELLAEIETDKATMEFESFQSGTILHHGVEEGQAAAVDSILAIVGKKGEDIQSLLNGGSVSPSPSEPVEKTEAPSSSPVNSEKIDTSSIPAIIIKMPKLSDTMEEGTVASWVKQEGDVVSSGEILAEIETDKATMEFESFEDGVLLYQGVKEGESAKVDAILAVIGEKGADYKKLIEAFQSNGSSAPAKEAPNDKKVEVQSNTTTTVVSQPSTSNSSVNGRLKVSPLAKKLADEKGIDLQSVQGSGDGGRIIKRDIEEFTPSAAAQASAPSMISGEEKYDEKVVSQMRKTIAKRLSESKFTAPHFYLTMDIDMDEAMNARKSINELPDTKISFNDLVIRASAAALKKHPMVNAAWLGDQIRVNYHVNIGVAVAVEDGLLVPVIRYADTKSLSQISAEVKDLAGKAREKKLQPQEWEGSTFSISNLGMYGIEEFTAIINPPNSCILAVGGIREEVVVKNGEMKIGHRMKVTLSCDHRVVDGATGAEFLNSLKAYLENPVRILA